MSQLSSGPTFARTCVAVLATGCLVLLAACTGGAESGPAAHQRPFETTAASSSSPAPPVTRARHLTVYDASFAGFLTAQHRPDRLWSGSSTHLGWLDPRTGTTHVVDAVPGVMLGIYRGSLYRTALYYDNVARYDVSGTPREVARQPAPSPLNVIAGHPGVWASDHFHGNLLRLDPDTLEVEKKVPLGTGHGPGPAALLWQGKNMWVNVMRDQSLALVEGRTGRVQHTVYLGGTGLSDGITRTSAGIWAVVWHGDRARTLDLVDAERFRVIARIDFTDSDKGGFLPVEINGETWMLVGDKLWHLSPGHGWQHDRTVDLHLPGLRAAFGLVAFGALWISNFHPDQIIRVGAQDLD